MTRKIIDLLGLISAVPFVLFMWIVSPFLLIRIGNLNSNALGDFIRATDSYITLKKKQSFFSLDLFFLTYRSLYFISNKKLLELFKKTGLLNNINTWFEYPYRLNMKLLGFHNKFNAIPSTYHIWECNKYASNIFFSEEDIKSLEKSLQELQLNDKIFICVHNRDSSYKKNFMPSLDWSFQNFRNSNPKNYIKSIDYFANQSIYTLRMGKGVEESLKIEDQYYFEYASSKYQSEFLDIALFYKCKFYIVSNTGVNAIGPLFRKPGVFVNFLPIEMETWQYFSYGSVILPKKILIKSTNKLMTFSQIWNIESHMGGEDVFLNALKDHFGDVEFIENTEEDILQAAIQMNLFIDDGYVETKEELELQKRFWSLGNSKEDVEKILFEYKYRISNKFLKDNIDLIC